MLQGARSELRPSQNHRPLIGWTKLRRAAEQACSPRHQETAQREPHTLFPLSRLSASHFATLSPLRGARGSCRGRQEKRARHFTDQRAAGTARSRSFAPYAQSAMALYAEIPLQHLRPHLDLLLGASCAIVAVVDDGGAVRERQCGGLVNSRARSFRSKRLVRYFASC